MNNTSLGIQLHYSQIKIREGRYRKTFEEDKVLELADSIKRLGLLHPFTIRTEESGEIYLVAGERRLKAVEYLINQGEQIVYNGQPLPQGFLPVCESTASSILEEKEIEVEENIRRVDLTWKESAFAVASLHKLRSEQNPQGWTLSDTAAEVKEFADKIVSPTQIHDQIFVADNIDRVRKATSLKEAKSQILKSLEHEFESEMGKRASTTIQQDIGVDLRVGDVLDILPQLPASHFHCIVTDPPYGVGAHNFSADTVRAHSYDDTPTTFKEMMPTVLHEFYRVCKAQAHIYVFCDLMNFFELSNWATKAGFDVWPRPLIWVKDTGQSPNSRMGPTRSYECVLFANKGGKCVVTCHPDIIVQKSVPSAIRLHAAQKPVEVYLNLLRRSCGAANNVLDAFCGSGTIFVAAKKLFLNPTGIDNDPASVEYAKKLLGGQNDSSNDDEEVETHD